MFFLFLILTNVFADDLAPIYVGNSFESKNAIKKSERYFTSQSYTSEKNPDDEQISETLKRLPGVHVRSQSGIGSLTTATTPGALNSASTAISIDSIPVPDPVSLGVNESLFPVSFVEGVEFQSPFYSSIDSRSVLIPTQGGRLNLLTQSKNIGGSEKGFGIRATYGTANTGTGAVSYRGSDDKKDFLVGVQGFSTRGDHPYINPETKVSTRRENNDSASGAVILKYRRKVFSDSVFQFLQLNSQIDRTNPGSLQFASRDHERDHFNLTGLSLNSNRYFAKTALTLSRVQNMISDTSRTDAHTRGIYAQAGTVREFGESLRTTFAVDELNEKTNDGLGVFSRNTNGVSAILNSDLAGIEVTPHLRYEYNSQYLHGFNASLTASKTLNDQIDLSLSHGYLTQYPAIMASQGYYAGGMVVLQNANLMKERASLTQASVGLNFSPFSPKRKLKLQSQTFHSLIRDRAVYTSLSFTQAQYRNVPLATVLGETISAELELTDELKTRVGTSLVRAWDRSSGHEFPYKPRLQSNAALEYEFFRDSKRSLSVSVEEDFMSKRFVNLSDEQSLSPVATTTLRADATLAGVGSFFLKVTNVFDEYGYSISGFPVFSREYVFGYRL